MKENAAKEAASQEKNKSNIATNDFSALGPMAMGGNDSFQVQGNDGFGNVSFATTFDGNASFNVGNTTW
eukprot:gnl/Chilomastix_caulleri/459.p3 GENE.gnl/Chilomastix_caulleri/459~~gnl/Chilomastix_caulleri/459.p3  ORF type:complete len:69 (+),score=28.43 gnl/Chilomastix_caulleri/459:590-796(+)